MAITENEKQQVEKANAGGKTPVVFIHGLWLLPSSWDNWAGVFEEAGYAAPDPGLAGRPRDRRGGAGEPRRPRQEDDRAGRRAHRRGDRRAGRRSPR